MITFISSIDYLLFVEYFVFLSFFFFSFFGPAYVQQCRKELKVMDVKQCDRTSAIGKFGIREIDMNQAFDGDQIDVEKGER